MINQINHCFWNKSYYYMANTLAVGFVESQKQFSISEVILKSFSWPLFKDEASARTRNSL